MQEMYAVYENSQYTHVLPNPAAVRMCGVEPTHIVAVREATDSEDWNSWGWWNSKKCTIEIIFPTRAQVEICFPYGHKVAEESGRGRLIPVVVEAMNSIITRESVIAAGCCEREVDRFIVDHKLSPDVALTPVELIAIVTASTPEWRGQVACDAPGLTPEQRVSLAMESTPGYRGLVACYAPGLSPAQRFTLAMDSTPARRGQAACDTIIGLTDAQRHALAEASTSYWRGEFARWKNRNMA